MPRLEKVKLQVEVTYDASTVSEEDVATIATHLMQCAVSQVGIVDHQLAWEYERIGKPVFDEMSVVDDSYDSHWD